MHLAIIKSPDYGIRRSIFVQGGLFLKVEFQSVSVVSCEYQFQSLMTHIAHSKNII